MEWKKISFAANLIWVWKNIWSRGYEGKREDEYEGNFFIFVTVSYNLKNNERKIYALQDS